MHLDLTDPVAFYAFGREIRWYGILVVSGVVAGYFLLLWRFRSLGLGLPRPAPDSQPAPDVPRAPSATRAVEIIFYSALIPGILGARIAWILVEMLPHMRDYGYTWTDAFKIWEGGLVSYGGFIGGTLGVILACRRLRLDPWKVADAFALVMPLGQTFGRIGCLLNKCCYGRLTDSPYYVTYPLEYGRLIPTQLNQSLTNLTIFLIILGLTLSRRIRRTGILMGLTMILYAIGRFLNEFNRGDYSPSSRFLRSGDFPGYTPAQVVAVCILIGGISLLILRTRPGVPRYDDPLPAAPVASATKNTRAKTKRRRKQA